MHLKRVRQVPVAPPFVVQLSANELRRRDCRQIPGSLDASVGVSVRLSGTMSVATGATSCAYAQAHMPQIKNQITDCIILSYSCDFVTVAYAYTFTFTVSV